MLLPPGPASAAAAFLTEIGIRPFSQNTKHKAALFANLGPLASSPPPSRAGGRCLPRLSPSHAAHHPGGAAPPPRGPGSVPGPGPAAPSPAVRAKPRTGRKVTSPPASGSGLGRGSAAPSRGGRSRSLRGAPRGPVAAPAPGSLRTSLPHRAEPGAGRRNRCPAPPAAAAAEAATPVPRAESSGAVAFRPRPGLGGRGRRAWDGGGARSGGPWAKREGEGEVSGPRSPAAAPLRPPPSPPPDSRRRAEGAAPSSTRGNRCPRRSPTTSPRPSP